MNRQLAKSKLWEQVQTESKVKAKLSACSNGKLEVGGREKRALHPGFAPEAR
jgi:hypothetical protein